MDLDSLKYAELQRLAKEMGLKANMKADKLLRTIKQHYKGTKEQSEQDVVNDVAAQDDYGAAAEASTTVAFVNARRRKGAGNKRKTDAAASNSTEVAPSAPEMEAVASSKRSRVSAQTEDKNEAPTTSGNAPQVVKAGKIPRLQKQMLKPVTPNFKKLHEAQFNKMESIDSYVQRKTKQMEGYKNEVKELKMLSEQTKQQFRGKPEATQKSSRTCLFSPAPVSKTQVEEKRGYTLHSASKAPPKKADDKKEVPFRPTVLSTRRVNVRFSEATKDNEYKKSLVKTPARMSPCVASSTPLKKAEDVKPDSFKATTLSATKTGPFVFTGNTSTCTTPGTQKKPAFDLKASLARPLGYRPHKGKLKPFGETKENQAANMSLTLNSHQKNYKQHQVQTREERRVIHTQDRKQKKNDLLGARRGLVLM